MKFFCWNREDSILFKESLIMGSKYVILLEKNCVILIYKGGFVVLMKGVVRVVGLNGFRLFYWWVNNMMLRGISSIVCL